MFSFIFNYRSDFEFRKEPEKSAPLLKTSTQLQRTTDGELVHTSVDAVGSATGWRSEPKASEVKTISCSCPFTQSECKKLRNNIITLKY